MPHPYSIFFGTTGSDHIGSDITKTYSTINAGDGDDSITIESNGPDIPSLVIGGNGIDVLKLDVTQGDNPEGMLHAISVLPEKIEGIEIIKLGFDSTDFVSETNRLDISLDSWRSHFPPGQSLEIHGITPDRPADFHSIVAFSDPWNWNQIETDDAAPYVMYQSADTTQPYTLLIGREVRIETPRELGATAPDGTIYGTPGDDELQVSYSGSTSKRAPVIVDGLDGDDGMDFSDFPYSNTDLYAFGGGGSDFISTANLNSTISGGTGGDTLLAFYAGRVLLLGEDGDDTFVLAGNGDFSITADGGIGNDLFRLARANELDSTSNTADAGNLIRGGEGSDRVLLNSNGEWGDLFSRVRMQDIEVLDLSGSLVKVDASKSFDIVVKLTASALQNAHIDQLIVSAENLRNIWPLNLPRDIVYQVTLEGFSPDQDAAPDGYQHYIHWESHPVGDGSMLVDTTPIRLSLSPNIQIVGAPAYVPPSLTGE